MRLASRCMVRSVFAQRSGGSTNRRFMGRSLEGRSVGWACSGMTPKRSGLIPLDHRETVLSRGEAPHPTLRAAPRTQLAPRSPFWSARRRWRQVTRCRSSWPQTQFSCCGPPSSTHWLGSERDRSETRTTRLSRVEPDSLCQGCRAKRAAWSRKASPNRLCRTDSWSSRLSTTASSRTSSSGSALAWSSVLTPERSDLLWRGEGVE